MGMRRKVTSVMAGLLIVFGAAAAEAGPMIDGSFSIFSYYKPVDGETGAATGVGAATGIDFLGWFGLTDPAGSGDFMVTGASGDFIPLAGSFGSIKDFTFSGPSSAAYPSLPIAGFESLLLGGLTFDLQDVHVEDQNNSVVHLVGTGVFNWTSAGFNATPGEFNFYGTANGVSLAFNSAAPVPEPASVFLLGSGVVAGIGSLRRRRRAA